MYCGQERRWRTEIFNEKCMVGGVREGGGRRGGGGPSYSH